VVLAHPREREPATVVETGVILSIEVEKVVPTSESAQNAQAAEKTAAECQDRFDLQKVREFSLELLMQYKGTGEKP
jgi:hypothetical protein